MIKWVKGFIAGVSSVALLVSFGVVIFYQALVEEMRNFGFRTKIPFYNRNIE